MAKRGGNPQNLNPPLKSGKKARELGRLGGIKSGIAKREKKLMSEFYADLLAKEHEIKINGGTGIVAVMKDILTSDDYKARVSMLKEIRETQSGNKLTVDVDESLKEEASLISQLLGK